MLHSIVAGSGGCRGARRGGLEPSITLHPSHPHQHIPAKPHSPTPHTQTTSWPNHTTPHPSLHDPTLPHHTPSITPTPLHPTHSDPTTTPFNSILPPSTPYLHPCLNGRPNAESILIIIHVIPEKLQFHTKLLFGVWQLDHCSSDDNINSRLTYTWACSHSLFSSKTIWPRSGPQSYESKLG